MPTMAKHDDGKQVDPVPSNMYAQPWWRGFGNDNTQEHEDHPIQLQSNGEEDASEDVSEESESYVAPQSDLNGSHNQEQHGEPTQANSQMELVGHSIMLTSPYPYPDPQMMSYGAPVHPHFYGFTQNRMALPLQMEEEPVYVNAKQYNGILRRRQMRAKAELEKKAIQARKPYLHESRHKHAMRRARGTGGRFLNTKKVENSSEVKGTCTQSGSSSGSEHFSNGHELSSPSSYDQGGGNIKN